MVGLEKRARQEELCGPAPQLLCRGVANLLEPHVGILKPQPGEHQHDQHVGEGKPKPRGEVHGVFAVRKQPEGRNTRPHLYLTLSSREQAG